MIQKNPQLDFGDTILSEERLGFLKLQLLRTNELEGDICEVGVYKGGSSVFLSKIKKSDDILYLFDTFEGIPNQSEHDNIHVIGDFFDSPYEKIVSFFCENDTVKIYKGIFPQETGKFVSSKKFKFVHLDVDTFISYKDSLEFFYDKLVVGGIILFDDYNADTCLGAKKAVDEFFINKPENVVVDITTYITKK